MLQSYYPRRCARWTCWNVSYYPTRECNYQKLKSPLIINLLARGLIHPDPLHLGLDAAADGAVLDRDGRPSNRIFTLGSAAKGMLYETTAVPELRVQAKALAERLIHDPERSAEPLVI